MWKRKELKKQARKVLKGHYLAAVGVCFVMMMFFDRYPASRQAIVSYNPAHETQEPVVEQRLATERFEVWESLVKDIAKRIDQKRESDPSYATKGVLSTLLNHLTQKTGPVFKIIGSISSFVQHHISEGVAFLISMLLSMLGSIFIVKLVQVGERRFFLEARMYPDTQIRRLLYLFKSRRILQPAKVMLVRQLRLLLWALTLVMYPVKYYEYAMIPYIVAENPSVPVKAAFSLSKQMMQGNKWKLFCLSLSYWYWYLFNFLSFGLVGIFFSNPYRIATETELYILLRQYAIDQQVLFYEQLNDTALVQRPAAEITDEPQLYPGLLEELKNKQKISTQLLQNYDRTYALSTYILFFFSFSVMGWLWEVGIHLVEDGQFVNRGVLLGPWLPIYGSGGVIIVFLLRKMGKWPILTFLSSMLLCSIVEYFTSWVLELSKGAKWWDYSGYLFNLNGRICLEGALIFGMGGCLFIYFLAPWLDDLYRKISIKTRWFICLLLLSLFVADSIYSYVHPNMGKGITDYDACFFQHKVMEQSEKSKLNFSQIHDL